MSLAKTYGLDDITGSGYGSGYLSGSNTKGDYMAAAKKDPMKAGSLEELAKIGTETLPNYSIDNFKKHDEFLKKNKVDTIVRDIAKPLFTEAYQKFASQVNALGLDDDKVLIDAFAKDKDKFYDLFSSYLEVVAKNAKPAELAKFTTGKLKHLKGEERFDELIKVYYEIAGQEAAGDFQRLVHSAKSNKMTIEEIKKALDSKTQEYAGSTVQNLHGKSFQFRVREMPRDKYADFVLGTINKGRIQYDLDGDMYHRLAHQDLNQLHQASVYKVLNEDMARKYGLKPKAAK